MLTNMMRILILIKYKENSTILQQQIIICILFHRIHAWFLIIG